jgi:hypothetical protein
VDSAFLTLGDTHFSCIGDANLSPEAILLNMDVSADAVDWEKLSQVFGEPAEGQAMEEDSFFTDLPVKGVFRCSPRSFTYDRFTWSPLEADVFFNGGGVRVDVRQAVLCGISSPGSFRASSESLFFDFELLSKNEELNPTLSCIEPNWVNITGNFDLRGRIQTRGSPETLLSSLEGSFEFLARKGHIYRAEFLARIFALLNVTKVFRGKTPDFKKGFPYDSISLKGDLHEGKLILREGILDGPTMQLAGEGDVDLIDRKIKLEVLVAPLRTTDRIGARLPLVRPIIGGALLAVPVTITGDLADPSLRILAPAEVGSRVLGIMENTLRTPFRLMEPVLPRVLREEADKPQRNDSL